MSEMRRSYDPEFCVGVVRIVLETKRPIGSCGSGSGDQRGHVGDLGEGGTR
jgi:hypothetical protein